MHFSWHTTNMHASGDTFVEPIAIIPRDATRIVKASRRWLTPGGAGSPDGEGQSAAAIPFAQTRLRPMIGIALPPNIIRLATLTMPPAVDSCAGRQLRYPGDRQGSLREGRVPPFRNALRRLISDGQDLRHRGRRRKAGSRQAIFWGCADRGKGEPMVVR